MEKKYRINKKYCIHNWIEFKTIYTYKDKKELMILEGKECLSCMKKKETTIQYYYNKTKLVHSKK